METPNLNESFYHSNLFFQRETGSRHEAWLRITVRSAPNDKQDRGKPPAPQFTGVLGASFFILRIMPALPILFILFFLKGELRENG
jgi:hypothetical protein